MFSLLAYHTILTFLLPCISLGEKLEHTFDSTDVWYDDILRINVEFYPIINGSISDENFKFNGTTYMNIISRIGDWDCKFWRIKSNICYPMLLNVEIYNFSDIIYGLMKRSDKFVIFELSKDMGTAKIWQIPFVVRFNARTNYRKCFESIIETSNQCSFVQSCLNAQYSLLATKETYCQKNR